MSNNVEFSFAIQLSEMLISFIYCIFQVMAVNDTRTKVTVKLIPRIDLQALAAKFVIYIHLSFSASSFL